MLSNAPSLIVHHFYVSSPHPPFYYYMYALFPWNDVHTTSSAFENICTCTVGFLTQNTYFHSHCDQFMHWKRKYVKCKSWAISLFLNFVWNIFLSVTHILWQCLTGHNGFSNVFDKICLLSFVPLPMHTGVKSMKNFCGRYLHILLSTFSFQFLCSMYDASVIVITTNKAIPWYVPFFNADCWLAQCALLTIVILSPFCSFLCVLSFWNRRTYFLNTYSLHCTSFFIYYSTSTVWGFDFWQKLCDCEFLSWFVLSSP